MDCDNEWGCTLCTKKTEANACPVLKECWMDLKIMYKDTKDVESVLLPLVDAIGKIANEYGVMILVNEPHERDTTDSDDAAQE